MSTEPQWMQLHVEAVRRGEDTYIDPETKRIVFTETYHLRRGQCCESECRHCPYRKQNKRD